MGPIIDIGCTLASPQRDTTSPKMSLYQVIEAIRHEIPLAGDRSVADVVLYMMDTGRIKVDRLPAGVLEN